MSISKVNGTLETQIGEHCRIKVVAFKRDGIYINDQLEIKKEFPPEGFIFAPHFFNQKNLKLNSLIEFPYRDYRSTKKEGDLLLLDYTVECKVIGFHVFNLTENILLSKYSINQVILNNYVEKFDSQHFYIHCNESIYGPFKRQNLEILPKTGKEVCRYNTSELTIYSSGDCSYLLSAPLRNSDKVDCMTSSQLNGWLKEQLKILKIDIDFNLLLKALESQELVDLDRDRMERVLTGIDQILFTHSELKDLASSSEKFEVLYSRSLKKIEKEIKEELINPILSIKNEIEVEISDLSTKKEKILKETELYMKKLDSVRTEYDFVISNRIRLIEDIKLHTAIGDSNSKISTQFTSFYEHTFKSNYPFYNNITEFIDDLNSTIDSNEGVKNNLGYNSILQLKDKKYLLSDNVELILQISKLSNNCKILIQQVEPDWLKFEQFFDNGLKQIYKSAHENPDLIHFLILEDINMASIECFGKPFLDLIDGIRLRMPGLDENLPKNLWIFGIPVFNNDGVEIGLPLIKNTYRNWGFLPKQETPIVFKNTSTTKCLSVENILDHNSIIPSFSNDYFS